MFLSSSVTGCYNFRAEILYGIKSNISFFSSRHFKNPSSFCQKEKRESDLLHPLPTKVKVLALFYSFFYVVPGSVALQSFIPKYPRFRFILVSASPWLSPDELLTGMRWPPRPRTCKSHCSFSSVLTLTCLQQHPQCLAWTRYLSQLMNMLNK